MPSYSHGCPEYNRKQWNISEREQVLHCEVNGIMKHNDAFNGKNKDSQLWVFLNTLYKGIAGQFGEDRITIDQDCTTNVEW